MQSVNSFDIFDTLIARRCIEPKKIFAQVGQIIAWPHFSDARVKAEQALAAAGLAYTFDDIYERMRQDLSLDQQETEDLKTVELAVELENVIPITENIRKVRNGDLLISDMYLPASAIRLMLERAGLRAHVGLIVTNNGKHTGSIWSQIAPKVKIVKHLGDNQHSDVRSPIANGIFAEHFSGFAPSDYEKFFIENGLVTLAQLVRELRLRHIDPGHGAAKNIHKEIQFNNNIPFLLLSAAYTNHLVRSRNLRGAAFCSRDCLYLHDIYRQLFEDDSLYLYTSRLSRIKCSPDYESYVRKKITGDHVVVDMCGTGWSLGALYQRLGIQPTTLLLHFVSANGKAVRPYDAIRQYTPPDKLEYIIGETEVNNALIEMLNYTGHGMVEDVTRFSGDDNWYPVQESPDYPREVREFVEIIEEAHQNFRDTLKNHDKARLVEEMHACVDRIPAIMSSLYADIGKKAAHLLDIWKYHRAQDEHTTWKLNKQKAIEVAAA